jgi:hypothetical protein
LEHDVFKERALTWDAE